MQLAKKYFMVFTSLATLRDSIYLKLEKYY